MCIDPDQNWKLWSSAVVILAVTASSGCEPGDSGNSDPTTLPAPTNTAHKESLVMRVTAEEFKWHIRYPGSDGRLDTPDDILTHRHLHLPENSDVSIDLQSKDYVYSFYLPHIGLVEVAVPNLPFTVEFHTAGPGTHELLGSQMCGYAHPDLLGTVVIHPSEDFKVWLAQAAKLGASRELPADHAD